MIIGVPKETTDKELRVGMIPEGIAVLVERGHRVLLSTMQVLAAAYQTLVMPGKGPR